MLSFKPINQTIDRVNAVLLDTRACACYRPSLWIVAYSRQCPPTL